MVNLATYFLVNSIINTFELFSCNPYGKYQCCPDRLSLLNMLWIILGVLSARDALRAVTAGVDGILVSNHGGRQLADVPAPVSC